MGGPGSSPPKPAAALPSHLPGGTRTSGLSLLQDVLRPTLRQGLLELSTQSCPLGATSGLAAAGAERGGTTMDTAISSRLRLTQVSGFSPWLIPFKVRECRGYHGNQGPGGNRSSIPACPSSSHSELGV